MKKDLEKRLDGVHTRLLMRAENVSWKDHQALTDIYGNITPISTGAKTTPICWPLFSRQKSNHI